MTACALVLSFTKQQPNNHQPTTSKSDKQSRPRQFGLPVLFIFVRIVLTLQMPPGHPMLTPHPWNKVGRSVFPPAAIDVVMSSPGASRRSR